MASCGHHPYGQTQLDGDKCRKTTCDVQDAIPFKMCWMLNEWLKTVRWFSISEGWYKLGILDRHTKHVRLEPSATLVTQEKAVIARKRERLQDSLLYNIKSFYLATLILESKRICRYISPRAWCRNSRWNFRTAQVNVGFIRRPMDPKDRQVMLARRINSADTV